MEEEEELVGVVRQSRRCVCMWVYVGGWLGGWGERGGGRVGGGGGCVCVCVCACVCVCVCV